MGDAGLSAVREKKEYEAIQNLKYLQELGVELINENFEKESRTVAISLRNIGSKAALNKLEETSKVALKLLRELSEKAFEKKYADTLFSLARALQEIGKSSAKAGLKLPSKQAVEGLEEIGLKAVEHKMEVLTLWSTLALGEIAYEAGKKELKAPQARAKAAREAIIKAAEAKAFVTRAQIELYPQLICDTVKSFGDYPALAPAGYEPTSEKTPKANEEFTEEEFFKGESENKAKE
ncbi:MAG: hypothetical protein PHD41_01060 [Methanosarcinaceae archaeon]|nr:hypothetical protein [Methanosarcinaceae archaeon]MDD4330742.1 hypothetical protein [Methanosarcinaceae archaeon]